MIPKSVSRAVLRASWDFSELLGAILAQKSPKRQKSRFFELNMTPLEAQDEVKLVAKTQPKAVQS
eukprot:9654512-Karenia_brevis.AAC.1